MVADAVRFQIRTRNFSGPHQHLREVAFRAAVPNVMQQGPATPVRQREVQNPQLGQSFLDEIESRREIVGHASLIAHSNEAVFDDPCKDQIIFHDEDGATLSWR